MSHLFERINLKNQQSEKTMNETGRNSLFFEDCLLWPRMMENQNLIETTTLTSGVEEILGNTTQATTQVSKNVSLLNDDENEATNPFIYPPTELTPQNIDKNDQEGQYPLWLKVVFFCVIGERNF
uniref:Uncharacterized protein n=1 Tax=Meloidogyne hapla TaxID=6305 RepID=A0A1I8BJH4_MELHA